MFGNGIMYTPRTDATEIVKHKHRHALRTYIHSIVTLCKILIGKCALDIYSIGEWVPDIYSTLLYSTTECKLLSPTFRISYTLKRQFYLLEITTIIGFVFYNNHPCPCGLHSWLDHESLATVHYLNQ